MSAKIILFSYLFSLLLPESIFPGIFGEELKQLLVNNYKTSSTLGYNNQEIYSNEELNILDANEDGTFNVLDIVVFVQTIVGE